MELWDHHAKGLELIPLSLQRKQEVEIQEAFTWTPWGSGTFLQCNVRLSQNVDYTMDMAMDHYVKGLEPIPLGPQRKKEVDSDITENKRTQLRGLLGGV